MPEESKAVKEGRFSATATLPDGKTEEFGYHDRKVEVTSGGSVIVTNNESGRVTVLPPGTKITTD